MENHHNCIYMYINKINKKRYIGQAKDFTKRFKTHRQSTYNENNRGYNLPFHKAIRKYGMENFEIIILKKDLQTQCLLNFWESYYIEKYNSLAKNGYGYNISSGGSNGNNFAGKTEKEMEILREKIRRRMSEANPMYSEQTRRKISVIVSERHKNMRKEERDKINNKIRIKAMGRKHSQETKDKLRELFTGGNSPNAKKIKQYDLDGNLIKIWGSYSEACKYYNVTSSCLSNCLIKGNNYSLGFIWVDEDNEITEEIIVKAKEKSNGIKGEKNPMYGKKHSDETKKKISKKHIGKNSPKSKKIAQYDLNENLIKIWDCGMDVQRQLKIKSTSISVCCRFWEMNCDKNEWFKKNKGNPQKKAGGYIWKYTE